MTKNQIDIKQANLLHLNQLANLFKGYCNFYQTTPTLDDCCGFIEERLINKDSTILIAFIEQEPAGFLQVYPTFSSVAMKKIWVLNDLYVDQPYRRCGAARKLLSEIERQALSKNIFSLKLATQKLNHSAKSLYETEKYSLNTEFEHFSKIIG